MPSTRIATKIFSPFACTALVLAAMIAALLMARTLEVTLGPDAPILLYIIADLLAGGTVLYAGGRILLSLEELRQPRVLDHFRRCAALYLVFLSLGISLAVFVDLGDPGGGGSLAIMLCGAAYCAIIIDALVLRWHRQKHSQAGSGGAL